VAITAGDNSGDENTGTPVSITYFGSVAPGGVPASALLSICGTFNIADSETGTLAAKLQESADGTTWTDVPDTEVEETYDGPATDRAMVLEIPFKPSGLLGLFRVSATATLSHDPGEEDEPDTAMIMAAAAFNGFGIQPAPSLAGLFNAPPED